MIQVALDPPKHKNGNGSHGRRERDLAAAETLRREQLRQIAELRAQITQCCALRVSLCGGDRHG